MKMKKRVISWGLVLVLAVLIPFLIPEVLSLFSGEYLVITDEEGERRRVKREEAVLSGVLSLSGEGAEAEEIKVLSVIIETAIRRKNFVPNFSSGYLWSDKEGFSEEEIERIRGIISSVKGQYLIYENEPIIAAFHQSSGGKTVAGEEPYLKSVPSDSVISYQSIKKEGFETLKVNKTDEGGIVLEVLVDGKAVSGSEFRKAYSIKSAAFEISDNGSSVRIKNYGIGHLLGLSLSGAREKALSGEDYKAILSHYYKGVSLVSL